jgi:uncharacterized protein GlcG (DUF336 family)
MNIGLEVALELISAAKEKAGEIKVPMVIAVVDAGGNLVAQHRMDGALLVSIGISLNKAYTAVAVQMPTHELSAVSQPDQPLFGIHNAEGGRIIIFGGGFPLELNGEIVGGIGVSGGTVEEDIKCATAGLDQFKDR